MNFDVLASLLKSYMVPTQTQDSIFGYALCTVEYLFTKQALIVCVTCQFESPLLILIVTNKFWLAEQ